MSGSQRQPQHLSPAMLSLVRLLARELMKPGLKLPPPPPKK